MDRCFLGHRGFSGNIWKDKIYGSVNQSHVTLDNRRTDVGADVIDTRFGPLNLRKARSRSSRSLLAEPSGRYVSVSENIW